MPIAHSPSRRRPLAQRAWLAACCCLLAGSALAQVSADSEEQRRRAQQDAKERQQRQQEPTVRLTSPAPTLDAETWYLPAETPCFLVQHITLAGEHRQAFGWLEPWLAGYAGRCIGLKGINQIVQRASALIVAKGYITTRLGIPEQDLSSGTLRLALVPGVIRQVRIIGNPADHSWRSALPARPGDLLNLRDIEQGIEQLKRVPSQEVSITIAPGIEPGESDIVLNVRRGQPWHIGVRLDDSGVKATGRLLAGLSLRYDNPLGWNDLVSVILMSNADRQASLHGTQGYSLQYSVPWGYWTLFLSSDTAHYLQTNQGDSQTFQLSGKLASQEMKLQRIIYRGQTAKATLQFRALHNVTNSYVEDTEIPIARRNSSAAEIGMTHRQSVGDAQIDLALAHRQGVPWFGGQSDARDHSADSATFGYGLQTLDLTVSVPFRIATRSLRWQITLHSQTSNSVLYAADHIAIGGRYTVRGFDGESMLAGDSGWYLRNEIEMPLFKTEQTVYAGIDHGRVGGPGAQKMPDRQLTGAVLGLRGRGYGFDYDLFTGWSLAQPEGFSGAKASIGFQLSYQFNSYTAQF